MAGIHYFHSQRHEKQPSVTVAKHTADEKENELAEYAQSHLAEGLQTKAVTTPRIKKSRWLPLLRCSVGKQHLLNAIKDGCAYKTQIFNIIQPKELFFFFKLEIGVVE